MTKRPGRAKGTRVIACRCGRRVAGVPGQRVRCPGCQRHVTVQEQAPGGARCEFLPAPTGSSEAK